MFPDGPIPEDPNMAGMDPNGSNLPAVVPPSGVRAGNIHPVNPPMTNIPQPNTPPISPVPPKKASKAPIIILSVLLGIFVIGAGVLTYFFIDRSKKWDEDKSSMESQIEGLNKEKQTLEGTVESKNSEIRGLENDKNDLNSRIESLESDNSTLRNQIDQVGVYKDYLDRIQKLDESDATYYSSQNVVVLSPGETKSFTVRYRHQGSFTLHFESDNRVVTPKWDKDWTDDNQSCLFYVTAGSSPGATLITFTNNQDSRKFEVLAIVQ